MNASVSFRFHGLARLSLRTDDARARRFFEAEYGRFRESAATAEAPVRLEWRRGRSSRSGLRSHSHKVLARWAYRIGLDGQGTHIEAQGNGWAIPMVHHMLVHPALRWTVSQHGTLLLHAAALAIHGRSLILTGSGGAGKTTTAALLLAYGDAAWRPHADDYVFLSAGGSSLAYPTRSHVYQSLVNWVPAVGQRLTGEERLRLRLLWAVRRASGERIKWPVRVEPSRLWPGRDIVDKAQASAIVILRRGDGRSKPTLHPIAEQDFPLQALVRMNFDEARHFVDLVEKGVGPRPRRWREDWERSEAEILRSIARTVPAYYLDLPGSPPAGREARRAVIGALEELIRRTVQP